MPRRLRAQPGRPARARRPMSAWSATRSAAASAGTRAARPCGQQRLAIELVTADGPPGPRRPRARAGLFWALRGGGGNFGVVTALEISCYPIAEVYAGVLFFPLERAGEVLHAWREWIGRAGGGHLGRPDDAVPADRGRAGACADTASRRRGRRSSAPRRRGASCSRPLRGLGPAIDTFAMVASGRHRRAPHGPAEAVPYAGAHQLLADLTAGRSTPSSPCGPGSGSPLVSFELRHLGGALARDGKGNGALASLPETYMTFGVARSSARSRGAPRGRARPRGRRCSPRLTRAARTSTSRSRRPTPRFLRAEDARPASGRQGRRRPRRDVPVEPRARLNHGRLTPLNRTGSRVVNSGRQDGRKGHEMFKLFALMLIVLAVLALAAGKWTVDGVKHVTFS